MQVTKQLEAEIQREEDEKASKANMAIELEKQKSQESDSSPGESPAEMKEGGSEGAQAEVQGQDREEQ
jgi:hypothetical protein